MKENHLTFLNNKILDIKMDAITFIQAFTKTLKITTTFTVET